MKIPKVFHVSNNGVLRAYTGSAAKVVVPEVVTTIAAYAFERAFYTETIVIGKNVSKISVRAFDGVENLKAIVVDQENAYFSSRDGVLYNKNQTKLLHFPKNYGKDTYDVPQGVTAIAQESFSESNVKCVTLPDSVKTIGNMAFYMCERLKKINIPSNVTSIGDHAFCNCFKMEKVTVPNGAKIGEETFYNCPQVVFLCPVTEKIAAGCPAEGTWDFRQNGVNILDGLARKVAALDLYARNRMQGIEYPQQATEINDTYIRRQRKRLYKHVASKLDLFKYMLDNKVVPIDDALELANNVDSIENVEARAMLMNYVNSFDFFEQQKAIDKREKQIEKELFADPNSEFGLKLRWKFKKNTDSNTITITGLKQPSEFVLVPDYIGPNKVTAIGNRCFKNCQTVHEVVFPDTITTLGDKIFAGCTKLQKVVVGKGVSCVETHTFDECTIKEIVFSEGLRKIKSSAFEFHNFLQSITLPDSLETIGGCAFNNCYRVAIDYLPSKIKKIGYRAFSNCCKLKTNIHQLCKYIGTKDNPYHYLLSCRGAQKTLQLHEDCKIVIGGALDGCRKIDSVDLSKNYNLWKKLLPSLSLLQSIDLIVGEDNPYFSLVDNVLYDKDYKTLIRYGCKDVYPTVFDVPRGVKTIGYESFLNRYKVTTVYICDTVTTIEERAFAGCSRLSKVHIGPNVTKIASNSFSTCKWVKFYCKQGSYAEQYAKSKKIDYVLI